MCQRDPIQCIIPPYITERLSRSSDAAVRVHAEANLAAAKRFRFARTPAQGERSLLSLRTSAHGRHRLLYDARGRDTLPGALVRSEGEGPVDDPAVNEAFDHAGATYDFYKSVFQRDSLDGRGMALIGSVHVGESAGHGRFVPLDNAFWDGKGMAYGDGDGIVFQRFTRSLDVVGHELTQKFRSTSAP